MSENTYTQTIDSYELVQILSLNICNDFELLKRMLFSNLQLIYKVAGSRDEFKLVYQKQPDGTQIEESFTSHYSSDVISVCRIDHDKFKLVSNRPWNNYRNTRESKFYLNSPFVESEIWKKAILLLSICRMEITCDFGVNLHVLPKNSIISANLTILNVRTGDLFDLGDVHLRNDACLKHLAKSLPNGRLIITTPADHHSPCSNVSNDHLDLWFSNRADRLVTLDLFQACIPWDNPKEEVGNEGVIKLF